MKTIYQIVLGFLLLLTACESDLDQVPPNIASSNSLEDFTGVLNAAYYYQTASVTPLAVMGDFHANNVLMIEPPYTEFNTYGPNLIAMEDQFFGPFYTALYKSILSSNNVIENSTDDDKVGEAKFLRGLSYFKLVKVFGDVPINLIATPSTTDNSILARQSSQEVYESVIIPDLQDAIALLDNSELSTNSGRATRIAAQALLGKVFVQRGNFTSAEPQLAAVVNGASAAGISLLDNYADIFVNDLNAEVIFATQISSSVPDEYGFTEFWSWYGGLDTKSLQPLDTDLIAAFDRSEADGETDLRRDVNIDEELLASPKYPQAGGPDYDWIEIRLADVILLYAETLNENGSSPAEVLNVLDPIRNRAGLSPLDDADINTQTEVRQAIQDERRLELAFEGQRWFDLVRTGNAQAELGETISDNFLLFPIPISEILASDGVITQNPGY